MQDVNSMLDEAVKEENEEREHQTRRRVKDLVRSILNDESTIVELKANVTNYKKELKELQQPEEVKVEL